MPNPPRSRGRQVNAAQALALLLAFVLVAGLGGVLAAGLLLPGVAVANGATDLTVDAFDDLPTELEQRPLPEKSVILAADGTLLATFYDQNRVVVPLSEISEQLQHAVVATEDKRFYEHAGIDPTGMLRAFVRNQIDDSNQEGASTLTQQYVKNVLIEAAMAETDPQKRAAALEEARGANYARKLREAKLAIALEKTMSKDEILEKYLNIAQFGPSVYGAESAAQYYFSKPAKDLSYLEAATIAGITQSPGAWDPVKHPEDSQKRRNTVLGLMHEQGYITDDEYTTGVATPLADTLHVQPLRQGCMEAGSVVAGSGFFCDYVTKVITNDPAFGEDRDDRLALLYRGGLTITTTLDPRLQTIADTEVKNGIPVDDPSGVGSAIITVEPGTGKIVAMAQNRNYTAVAEHGDRDTSVNFNTDFAYGGSSGFAPGSTFKPFTLLEWLKKGHSLYETVNGSVRPLNENMFTTCGTKGPNVRWTPGNSEGGAGYMSVLNATRNSVNLAYLSMAMQLDMCDIMNGAADLGMHTAKGDPPGTNPSNVIGTDSVAPLSMAAAFATFASGGVYCTPIAITSVRDTDGNELPIPQANCHQAIEPQYANTISYALSGVWQGTAKAVGAPSFPAAGKTGTTSENEQTWFVGFTPRLATAVWVGDPNESKRQIKDMTINGSYVRRAFGATIAAPTWKRFMTQALDDGQPNPAFPDPDSNLVYGERLPVPSVLGKTEEDARSTLTDAGFEVTVASDPVSSDYPAGTVAAQSPQSRAARGARVTLTLSAGPAPERDSGDDDEQDDGDGRGDDDASRSWTRGPGGSDGGPGQGGAGPGSGQGGAGQGSGGGPGGRP